MNGVLKAKEKIKANRIRAEKEYEDVLAELCREENFEEKYRKLDVLNFEIAKREVYKLPCDDLLAERAELKKEVDAAFVSHGIEGIGKPNYSCKICSDTGYVNGKKCKCLEEERIKAELIDNTDLLPLPHRLKDVDFGFYHKSADKYAKYAKLLNNNFVKGELNFCTLMGAAGTGKTYLAEVAEKELLYTGASVSSLNAVKLNRVFLEYHCAFLENKAEIWDRLISPDVLLIDDLGVESLLNNVTVTYLYELLTERADQKTIITTNLDIRGLEDKYGQRIMSRLSDKRKSMVINIGGEDYRI